MRTINKMVISPDKFGTSFDKTKYKALAVLQASCLADDEFQGFTSLELACLAGVSYQSLASLLGRWHRWLYVNRSVSCDYDRWCYRYKTLNKTNRFIFMAEKYLDTQGMLHEVIRWQKYIGLTYYKGLTAGSMGAELVQEELKQSLLEFSVVPEK